MEEMKYTADLVFDGARLRSGQVLVTGDDGRILDLVPRQEAGADVQELKGILTPGFINCHCHLELSHMKGRIPEGTGLVDFVFKVVSERHHPEQEIREAIARAEDEMMAGGIVAVGDICNNTLTLAQKLKGRMRYYNFIEASGWLPTLSQGRFERARTIYETYMEETGKHNCSIVPHAPYSVSHDLWKRIMPYFENRVVSIHNQETAFEDEFFMQGTGDFRRMYELMQINNEHHQPSGKSSLQSVFSALTHASGILLVHNTFTREDDVAFVQGWSAGMDASPVYFCVCVNANRYIENVLPPLEMLRSQGCSIVLGTDSLASNHSLAIVDEMRTIRKHFPEIPLEEILQWATLNGAKALEMDKELGSFEKGKKPGIVLLDDINMHAQRLL